MRQTAEGMEGAVRCEAGESGGKGLRPLVRARTIKRKGRIAESEVKCGVCYLNFSFLSCPDIFIL